MDIQALLIHDCLGGRGPIFVGHKEDLMRKYFWPSSSERKTALVGSMLIILSLSLPPYGGMEISIPFSMDHFAVIE
jgi:hypothetical protein